MSARTGWPELVSAALLGTDRRAVVSTDGVEATRPSCSTRPPRGASTVGPVPRHCPVWRHRPRRRPSRNRWWRRPRRPASPCSPPRAGPTTAAPGRRCWPSGWSSRRSTGSAYRRSSCRTCSTSAGSPPPCGPWCGRPVGRGSAGWPRRTPTGPGCSLPPPMGRAPMARPRWASCGWMSATGTTAAGPSAGPTWSPAAGRTRPPRSRWSTPTGARCPWKNGSICWRCSPTGSARATRRSSSGPSMTGGPSSGAGWPTCSARCPAPSSTGGWPYGRTATCTSRTAGSRSSHRPSGTRRWPATGWATRRKGHPRGPGGWPRCWAARHWPR